MTKATGTALLLIAILAACLFMLTRKEGSTLSAGGTLIVHCAAGLQKPVSAIAKRYEEEYGVQVRLQFGGSGALEAQLEVAGGDLFLPADTSYIESARKKNLLREAIPVSTMRAGIVVPKGNPKKILTLEQLGADNLTLSLADESAAIGRHTRAVLRSGGLLDAIEANVKVTKPTVNNIVEDVVLGAVDAAIAWDAVAALFPEVEWIECPAFSKHPKESAIGVLGSAADPTRALHFARYLAARDQGLEEFAKAGFAVVEVADEWAERPEVTLFSGSMLRPAIEDLLHEFEEREGCHINTVFEGCGTLVAMMKDGGSHPAAYFSCDTYFMELVRDRFPDDEVVTSNEIILLTPKDNPKQLGGLRDLTRPGLKVGIADARKSALGFLTERMLARQGLLSPLQDSGNIIVLASKGDDLVNQMQVGALDAALLYRSNALASTPIMEHCSIVDLDDPLAIATQPFGVAADTPYPRLMQRLGDSLSSRTARPIYESLGFKWKKDETR